MARQPAVEVFEILKAFKSPFYRTVLTIYHSVLGFSRVLGTGLYVTMILRTNLYTNFRVCQSGDAVGAGPVYIGGARFRLLLHLWRFTSH